MQALNYKDDIKRQNKIASDWLIYYRERKMEHEEKRQELYSKKEKAVGLSTGLSKPTEGLAINLADHDLGNEARWLETIETVYSILNHKQRLILRLRQECQFHTTPPSAGRPGWIAPVQARFGGIKQKPPAEQTLKDIWYHIVNYVVRLALMKKCNF